MAKRRIFQVFSSGNERIGYSHPGFMATWGSIGTSLIFVARSSATKRSATGELRKARGSPMVIGRLPSMSGRLCIAALHGVGDSPQAWSIAKGVPRAKKQNE